MDNPKYKSLGNVAAVSPSPNKEEGAIENYGVRKTRPKLDCSFIQRESE